MKRFHGPRASILALAFLFSIAVAGCTGTAHSRGWRAYEQGEYSTAMKEWKPLAESGDAQTEYLVGLMHDEGRGVAADHAQAANWYGRAAEQGHVAAQNNLGLLFYEGRGVPQSYAEAEKWYRKAADVGFAPAQSNLGVLYMLGQGVEQDHRQARALFTLAAQQGNANAKRVLETAYSDGGGDDARPDVRAHGLSATRCAAMHARSS